MAKPIKITAGILSTTETDFSKVISAVLSDLGYPSFSGCCTPSGSLPTNGQVQAFNSTTGKLEFISLSGGGISSPTNLTYAGSATSGVITNTNGTGFTIPTATATTSGLASPAMFNALSGSTTNNARLGANNTYIAALDNNITNGIIDFVIDGVTVMTLSSTKLSLNGLLIDPPSGLELMLQNTNPGGVKPNTLWLNASNNHLMRGTVDLEAGSGAVPSVFGRTGVVVAENGDYTTAQVTESTNLYFTNTRALSTPIAGFASLAGALSSSDSILQAINKLDGNMVANDAAYIHKTGPETISGVKTFTSQPVGITASSIVFTPPAGMTATNVQDALVELYNLYVDTFNQPI